MPDLDRLHRAYRRETDRLRTRLTASVGAAWVGLGSYRDADIDRFATQVVPMVAGAQRQMAATTDGYYALHAAEVLGGTQRPAGVRPTEVTGAAVRNGTAPDEVYHRPGKTVWWELSKGAPLGVAVERGLRRAVQAAATDLQLTKTHTARRSLQGRGGVVGFRRILGSGDNCGLCIVASTQRYHKGDLLPIHPSCGCDVGPLYGDRDPGTVIDRDLLDRTHQAIEDRFGVSDAGARDPLDYRKVLITRTHGEYGPTLSVASHRFTSLADLRL